MMMMMMLMMTAMAMTMMPNIEALEGFMVLCIPRQTTMRRWTDTRTPKRATRARLQDCPEGDSDWNIATWNLQQSSSPGLPPLV